MWRLRMKREWIREQLRALRGFPTDADHASCEEPWDDAFGAAPAPSYQYVHGIQSSPDNFTCSPSTP